MLLRERDRIGRAGDESVSGERRKNRLHARAFGPNGRVDVHGLSWKTSGDELYQMISIDLQSHALLKAKSPQDGREHVVGWTYQFGRGRVFATTLGHDMKTAGSPDYLQLLANGLLWSCNKLGDDGQAVSGYAGKGTP